MGIVSEKQDVSSWIPFFGSSSPLSAADRAFYSSIFQNSVLAGYRNSDLVPYAPLKDPTDQALALSLSACGKTAGKLLAAREGERVELHKEQITLIEHKKKISLLYQAALDQLELSKESLLSCMKERATLILQALSSIPLPPFSRDHHYYYVKRGEFDRAQYLRPLLQAFQDTLSHFEKKAETIAAHLQPQESEVLSLELAFKEENPARALMSALATLGSRVESLRGFNGQLAQENKENSVRQEEEITSRKKTHSLFFKEISTQIEKLQQTTSQDLPSWTSQTFLPVVVSNWKFGCMQGVMYIHTMIRLCPNDYAQGAALSQHRLSLLCDDVVRLAKGADLFTGNP